MTKTNKQSNMNLRAVLAATAAATVLAGCATSGNPKDPIEGYNRAMFSFNETVDKAVIKPVAQGYNYVTPQPVQTGVSNFFGNLADIWTSVNNLLQGKPGDALSDAGRVLINSTVGILGLFDVATPMGLEKHEEDFGQTLGRWGVGDGAYVVLPILGPRTVRDTVGLAADIYTDPVRDADAHRGYRNTAIALRAIDTRADLLKAEDALEAAALDKYAYVRDAYLQHRRSAIYDGNPPRQADDAALPSLPADSLTSNEPVESTWNLLLVGQSDMLDVKALETPEPAEAAAPAAE
ncbi:MAG: VacJ family lipoprotein [Methyloversatilis sp.]|uniref:Lipoprotein n=1 Tax=Methyloversatilis universalis (strain ATCC BAA-1314 / DSM 25237 / JCM 13912 / CCUG 52030 / FAM5) TaxID=1000565 RepID=F5RDQ3_METUF|nr:VacJ family lipoprotein [Methyloversatilis universalis]EGK71034.1 Putative lipoprotein [Methyloversatilis universalis FAM5]MCP4638563.1 VacJ family lipoprotein [Methyloversatilis sp.]